MSIDEKSSTKKLLNYYIKESSCNKYNLNNIYITNAVMCARQGNNYRGNNIDLKNSTLNCSKYLLEQIEIEAKYYGYIKKALDQAQKLKGLDEKKIPSNIDYNAVENIALEAREKLMEVKPKTLGQASRISGVNPSDIAVLSVYIESMRRR